MQAKAVNSTAMNIDPATMNYGEALDHASDYMDANDAIDVFAAAFLVSMAFNTTKEEVLHDLIAHRKEKKQ